MGLLEQIEARLDVIEAKIDSLAVSPDPTPIVAGGTGPRWLDTPSCAAHIGVSKQTLSLWRSQGTGPPWTKVGNVVRYDREAVDRWMGENARCAHARR